MTSVVLELRELPVMGDITIDSTLQIVNPVYLVVYLVVYLQIQL